MSEQDRLTDEALRQEQQRQSRLLSESQRTEEQRRADESRREDSRRQEQRQQEERRRQERREGEQQRQDTSRGKEQEAPLHESTVKTLASQQKESEQSTIEYARKHGVPIAPASLSMSGRTQGEERQGESWKRQDKPAEKPQAVEPSKEQPKESVAVERLKAKMEAMKDKVQEHIKAQNKGKTQDMGHERG